MIKTFTTLRRVEGVGSYSAAMLDFFDRNEQYGFDGCLLFQNDSNDVDPWTMAQELLMRRARLTPFIAINPVYMHPYSVAQRISSLTRLYGRKLYLNFITGTSLSDLDALGGMLSHLQRYNRLVEYIEIIRHLLREVSPLSYDGQFYQTKNLRLAERPASSDWPEFFIAGSSEDANRARIRTGSGSIRMATTAGGLNDATGQIAVNFGIVACDSTRAAEEMLVKKFSPCYPELKELLDHSMSNSDSIWKQQLHGSAGDDIYRLEPLRHFNADCPYLVGNYSQVAHYILRYVQLGISTFIVEATEDDLRPVRTVMNIVKQALGVSLT